MGSKFYPLETIDQRLKKFERGDLFVLFGELFERGYAQGLVKQAQDAGMQIVGLTIGRREEGQLRALNADELASAEKLIGGKVLNIPFEAGFDLEETRQGSIVSQLNSLKIDTWQSFKLDPQILEEARAKGQTRFKNVLTQIIKEIDALYTPGKNIFFAHIIAGGIPRAKILLLIANRVFKTIGDKFIPSATFWNSDVGRIVDASFNEVTADTFKYLIEGSANLRKKVNATGAEVFYSAYGYHGTEILINGKYTWQTYTPYQQGHAKKRLEDHAQAARAEGIKATVYNCPEIRTNSSDIFVGVELSLLPFLKSVRLESSKQTATKIWDVLQAKLLQGEKLDKIVDEIESYFDNPMMSSFQKFKEWPLENNIALAELMIGVSESITRKHINRKDLITDYLSALIVKTSGKIIFESIQSSDQPVLWIGHKIIAQELENHKI